MRNKERRTFGMNRERRINLLTNKKGVLGQIFSTIVVLFVVVFGIGIFLAISGYIDYKSPAKAPAMGIGSSQGENVLSEILRDVKLKSGEIRDITVFDALILEDKGLLDNDVLRISLRKMLTEKADAMGENWCLVLAKSGEENPTLDMTSSINSRYSYNVTQPNPDLKLSVYFNDDVYNTYYGELISSYSFSYMGKDEKDQTIYVQTYYGRCLHPLS